MTPTESGRSNQSRAVEELPGWIRRSWTVSLVLGLLMVVLGVVLLFNVGASVDTLRWLVVFALALEAVEALATASARTRPWVGYLAAACYLIGAVVGVVWPVITLFALVLTVGAALLVGGLVRAGHAVSARATLRGWGWSLFAGVLSVVAGLIFLFGSPVVSVLVLALVLAVQIIMTGAMLVSLSLALRQATGMSGVARSA